MNTLSFGYHIKLCSICDHLSRTTHSLHKCIMHATRKQYACYNQAITLGSNPIYTPSYLLANGQFFVTCVYL